MSTAEFGYYAPSSTHWAEHWYLVQLADLDTDGITIDSIPRLQWEDWNTQAGLNTDLTGKTIVNAAAHKVDGAQGLPRVTGVAISSSAGNDSTYVAGDTIAVAVAFDSTMTVTGTPQLALTIGSATRQADYVSGTGTDTLEFQYVVAGRDADADGISIGASALGLNGGTIRGSGGTTNAYIVLARFVISNEGAHKVDGPQGRPLVTGVTISSSAGADSLYGVGDTIAVTVAFDSTVTVTGTPQLALTIGSATRQANYASGSASQSLEFQYEVASGEVDADGISIAADALTLNGGTIRVGTTNAVLALGRHAISDDAAHKVAGTAFVASVRIASTPVVGVRQYGRQERILVEVEFSLAVDVTGTPQLALSLNVPSTRQASYVSGTGTNTLVFGYTVVGADSDGTGISIGANALSLNGGTVWSTGTTTSADLSLAGHTISNDRNHRVNGVLQAPRIRSVAIEADTLHRGTYVAGQQIAVRVTWDLSVQVPGARHQTTLDLHIGDNVRRATYVLGNSDHGWLYYRYIVTRADVDADGISIPEDAVKFHSYTLERPITGENANISLRSTHGDYTISDATDHKVNGLQGVPHVTGVGIESDAGNDSTYGVGDGIEVGVKFSENVDVTGAPQLALTIGAQTRQARYLSGTGTDSLTFGYQVVAADADTDGLSIAASALGLNSGTIN